MPRYYDIGIKNVILDRKHYDAMGTAIWLYLWCIRHQTKSSGWVLGGALITYQTIQEEFDIGDRTLRRWLRRLSPTYIECTYSLYKKMRIRVMKPKKFDSKQSTIKFPEPEVISDINGRIISATNGRNERTRMSDIADKNVRFKQRERKRKIEPLKQEQPAAAICDWVPLDAWLEYKKMRDRISRPMTPYAVDLAVRKLDKLRSEGEDVREVLEQSIMNSWQGLFQVKGRNGNGNGKHSGKLTGNDLTNANLRAAGLLRTN